MAFILKFNLTKGNVMLTLIEQELYPGVMDAITEFIYDCAYCRQEISFTFLPGIRCPECMNKQTTNMVNLSKDINYRLTWHAGDTD